MLSVSATDVDSTFLFFSLFILTVKPHSLNSQLSTTFSHSQISDLQSLPNMASTAVATGESPIHPVEHSPSSVDRYDSSDSLPNFFGDAEIQVLFPFLLFALLLAVFSTRNAQYAYCNRNHRYFSDKSNKYTSIHIKSLLLYMKSYMLMYQRRYAYPYTFLSKMLWISVSISNSVRLRAPFTLVLSQMELLMPYSLFRRRGRRAKVCCLYLLRWNHNLYIEW